MNIASTKSFKIVKYTIIYLSSSRPKRNGSSTKRIDSSFIKRRAAKDNWSIRICGQ